VLRAWQNLIRFFRTEKCPQVKSLNEKKVAAIQKSAANLVTTCLATLCPTVSELKGTFRAFLEILKERDKLKMFEKDKMLDKQKMFEKDKMFDKQKMHEKRKKREKH
jgi:hypothetical protein